MLDGKEIGVTRAAELLGVSRQRVLQLVHAGSLPANKVGNVWVLDADAVAERACRTIPAGRPARVDVDAPDKRRYTLMNAEYEVLELEYDHANHHFSASHDIRDASRAPIGVISPRGTHATASALYEWWRHRSVPSERAGLEQRLAGLGLELPDELPFRSLGLSLSDQYWLRPEGAEGLRWEDVNFFDNAFESDTAWLGSVGGARTPDNTSEGLLPKRWVCRGSKRVLLKGGGGSPQVPYNEKIASALHRRLLGSGEFVSYEVEESGGEFVSACEDFLTRREEYIPSWYLRPRGKHADGRHALYDYLDTCEELGASDSERRLSEMIVCDYLLANTDRHWRNFGLVRNIDTLEYRVAPLFDSGNGLWFERSVRALESGEYAFESKPFNANPVRQLLMAPDVSWLDAGALEGFAEEAQSILAQSPDLSSRAHAVARGIERQVESVVRRLL